MGRLFGAEGVVGVANGELTCGLAMDLGRAAAGLWAREGRRPLILIGKDPRPSSDMLEAALAAGCCSAGAQVWLLGVIPTPGVACLVKHYAADGGIAISSSRDSCEYNGIQVFNRMGEPLSRQQEDAIEATALKGAGEPPCPLGGEVGRILRKERAAADYVRRMIAALPADLRGMKLAVDCANGAASVTARRLFEGLGAECVFLNDRPEGSDINAGCGCFHPEGLAEYVKSHRLFGGVAFDGGGERCLATDEQGNLIDGDRILFALALDRKEQGLEETAAVADTANLGFFRSCGAHGIQTLPVPEEELYRRMGDGDCPLGGDPSGRLILREFSPVGDGQYAAARFLALCREKGWKLSRLAGQMERYPQVALNVKADAAQKAAFLADGGMTAAIREADASLGEDGRVRVRPSHTEPLIRVTVEGTDFDRVNRTAVALADLIRTGIGYESGD